MFSLIYGFWKLLFQKTEHHVLILGLDHAGKTVRNGPSLLPCAVCLLTASLACARLQSVLERLKTTYTGVDPISPSKIAPTVGLNIGRMTINRQKLIFWDLGGSKALRSLWEKCARSPGRRSTSHARKRSHPCRPSL